MAYKDSCCTSELHQLPGVWFQVACQNAKCQMQGSTYLNQPQIRFCLSKLQCQVRRKTM